MLKQYLDGTLQHIGLPTDDMEKTVAFYQSIGFEILHERLDNGKPLKFLGLGNVVMETYMAKNGAANKPGAIHHLAFNCTDIVGCVKMLQDQHYQIIEGPNYLPFWDHGVEYVSILGPNAEVLEFNQRFASEEEKNTVVSQMETLLHKD